MVEIRYLKRLCKLRRKRFTLLDYNLYFNPDETFESSVELNSELSMENDVCSK